MGFFKVSDCGVFDKFLWVCVLYVIGVLKGAILGLYCLLLGVDIFKYFFYELDSLGIFFFLVVIDERKEVI